MLIQRGVLGENYRQYIILLLRYLTLKALNKIAADNILIFHFSLKNSEKIFMSVSAAVVIGTLRVKNV